MSPDVDHRQLPNNEYYTAGQCAGRELLRLFGKPRALEFFLDRAPANEEDDEIEQKPPEFWIGMHSEITGVEGTA
jgi:hypothetical protein